MTPLTTRAAQTEAVEVRAIKSALTTTEHVLRGGRFHLFLIVSGDGTLLSADGSTELAGPCFCWLPHGQAQTVRLEAGTRGAALSIPDLVLGRSMPSGSVGTHIRDIIAYPMVIREPEPGKLRKLTELVDTIEQELFANGPAAHDVMQHCLALLMIEIWRLSRPETASPRPLPRNIVHTFMVLVDLHLRDHWTIQQYARQMGVSRDRLNGAVRRATGRPPLAHIHERLITEAKALLTESGLQVAEVAYKLGFGDAAYFNRFFQRHEGMPPGRYRQAALKPRSEPDVSYAAWP
jgi:AraC family transcriptional activator of pobA